MYKNYSYNTLSFIVFVVLIVGSFSFFAFGDDTNLTLFEDFDRDGLSNAEEKTLGTNPKEEDSDGDGYSDGVEVESGYNPLIPAPGDRIIQEREPITITPAQSQTTNVTQKISEDLVSYLADAQENGASDITSEEFSDVISDAIEKEVSFENTPPVDLSEINIKKQDYDDLSEKKRKEKMREDAIEYLTTISYIFISNFPQGFFERPIEEFQVEIMQHLNGFSQSLTQFSFFEDMAKNALSAEEQFSDVEVPEDMLEIHVDGLYLLQYTGDIYKNGDYKNVNSDITPMISALAQIQGLVNLGTQFQDKIDQKLQAYEIDNMLLDL